MSGGNGYGQSRHKEHFNRQQRHPNMRYDQNRGRDQRDQLRSSITMPPQLRATKTYNHHAQWQTTKIVSPAASAAPNPILPSKNEVTELKNQIDEQIRSLQIELSSLRQQYSAVTEGVQPIQIPNSESLGVREVGGIIMQYDVVDSVIAKNRESARIAKNEAKIQTNQEMLLTCDTPHALNTMQTHDLMLPLLFTSVFYQTMIRNEKEDTLAEQYNAMNEVWEEQNKAVDVLNLEDHNFMYNWPNEMTSSATKTGPPEDFLPYTAPDVRMYIDPISRGEHMMEPTVLKVDNPIGEHKLFKERLRWSEEEKKIFFETFITHPKDFSSIAEKIPEKTVKDVIEFYYLNKEAVRNNGLQASQKKRGGKKKVISEGG